MSNTNERAELIAHHRRIERTSRWESLKAIAKATAEMLEADALELARLRELARDAADAATQLQKQVLVLKAQQVAVPAGWALVPIEPTPEMCAEGLEDEGVTIVDGKRYAHALWSVMLAAAQGEKP